MPFDITPDNHNDVVKRLCGFVIDAPDDVRDYGLGWYEVAHDAARVVAADLGVPVRNAAGMIACASPSIDAEVLVGEIERILTGQTSRVTGRQRAKVVACLRTEPTEILNQRTGPKTWAFFWNIYAPSLRDHVTVDGRRADIIANCMRPWRANRGIDVGGPGSRYESYEYVTEDAARRLRRIGRFRTITAVQVQAVTWCEGKRRERPGLTARGHLRKVGVHRKNQPYT